MMVRPPQSPDLNPIEQIWCVLENELDRSIHSKESLLSCRRHGITLVFSGNILTPERCAAVIAAKGGQTKY